MDLKEVQKEIDDLTGQIRDYADRSASEIKKFGGQLGDTQETLEKLNGRMEVLEDISKRLASLEAKADRPGGEGKGATDDIETKAFGKYLRFGEEKLAPEERKSLWTGDDTHGGYLVPTNLSNRILSMIDEVSDIRRLATVERISVGDTLEIPAFVSVATTGGWIGETTTPAETTHDTFAMLKIPTHEEYENPFATQKMLEDTGRDIEGWLADRIAMKLAQREGAAFVSGDGVGKPMGILSDPTVLTQTTNSGTAATLLDANGQANGLIGATYALKEGYSRNAWWLMRRASVGTLRAAKDDNHNYIWAPMANGQPATLLGYPIMECPDWPAVGAGAYAAAFGDIRAGYTIVDRLGITLLRDPLTHKPYVEFYTRKRVGGNVSVAEAIRLVICHV